MLDSQRDPHDWAGKVGSIPVIPPANCWALPGRLMEISFGYPRTRTIGDGTTVLPACPVREYGSTHGPAHTSRILMDVLGLSSVRFWTDCQ